MIDGYGVPPTHIERVTGAELHFRVKKSLYDHFQRAQGHKVDYQGYPMLLRLQNRSRLNNLLSLSPIDSGSDDYMDTIWSVLGFHAHQLAQRPIQLNGFEQNCHTLAFQTLAAADLTPPRALYEKYVRRVNDVRACNAAALKAEL